MAEIFQLVGVLVTIYFLAVKIVMLWKQCPEEEAKEIIVSGCKKVAPKIVSWWRENASGVPNTVSASQTFDYELSKDENYCIAANNAVKEILGESQYQELCVLNGYSLTLYFRDSHAGFPKAHITLTYNDENQKKRIEKVLESTTRMYLSNYRDYANVTLMSEWAWNDTLQLPMLVIMYSRNKRERKMLDTLKQSRISKITAKYGSVRDDTEEIDLF